MLCVIISERKGEQQKAAGEIINKKYGIINK
jgi:hypothetical protein